jgi:hypothetical protein
VLDLFLLGFLPLLKDDLEFFIEVKNTTLFEILVL